MTCRRAARLRADMPMFSPTLCGYPYHGDDMPSVLIRALPEMEAGYSPKTSEA